MKQLFLTIMMVISTVFSASAADTQITERKVPVKTVEIIEIKGSTEVVYQQGNKTEVIVRGAKDYVNLIVVENHDNVLTISQKDGVINGASGFFDLLKNGFKDPVIPVVYVTSPDIIGVSLTGSGDFVAKEKVDTDNLEITLKGSGDIDFNDIICDNIHANLQGSGDVKINNVIAINADYELKGSGDIAVNQQKVHQTNLNLYGSGDIKLKCIKCGLINAKVTGSGDIDIFGDVKEVKRSTRGSGDIKYHK